MGGETVLTHPNDSSKEWKIPKLNLRAEDLADATSQKILSYFTPYTLIYDAVLGVLAALYNLPTDAPKHIKSVTIIFRKMDGIAYTCGEEEKEIHMSLDYFGGAGDRFEHELKGVLWHEMVHVWQYNAKGTCPGGLIEGIADFVRLKAGLAPPHWKPGPRGRWDEGYEATGYFLDWIEGRFGKGFVHNLNLVLQDREWDDEIFLELLGLPLGEIWEMYKEAEKTDVVPPPPRPTELPS